jgi:hypothetical protein
MPTIDALHDMDFAEMRELVLDQTPGLKQVLNRYGDMSLLTYFNTFAHVSFPVSESKKNDITNAVHAYVTRTIDPTVADRVASEFRTSYCVSTADHHHPQTHPYSLSSSLIQSHVATQSKRKTVCIFSCSGISMNNSSSPRGPLFHTNTLLDQRLPFFSLAYRHYPVYGMLAYTPAQLEKTQRLLAENEHITEEQKNILSPLLEQIYHTDATQSFHYYSEQLTHTNYHLWKLLPEQSHIDLAIIPQEEIVNDLLLTHHLGTNSTIDKLLREPAYLESFELCFDGIDGAFSLHERTGTFLFWAIINGERKALWHNNGTLETEDGLFSIKLTPETITQSLQTKTLMPSMALTYIVISFYYGVICGGGFLQGSYLSKMKYAYLKLLDAVDGPTEERGLVEAIETDRVMGDFSFLQLQHNDVSVPATTFDLLLYSHTDPDQSLASYIDSWTVAEAVDQLMPMFYKVLYSKESHLLPHTPHPPFLYVK